jgi:hypothetical protein
MSQYLNETSAQLTATINYHVRASVKHQNMLDYHTQGETAAREELTRIQELQLQIQARFAAPLTAEFKDILGNLVARGSFVPATNEYTTGDGRKVAHWNASLCKIVPVAAVRSKLASWNKRSDPVTHARYLEQQRQRYAETHPTVQRRNPFVDY